MSEFMTGNELYKTIIDLRNRGWTDTQIIEHLLTVTA